MKTQKNKTTQNTHRITRRAWITLARARWEHEGDIEIDDTARTSTADPTRGAYVQAWVWVDRPTGDAQ